MTPEALAAALEAGARPRLLDLRTPEAFVRAHLPGSHCVPVSELGDRFGELDRLAEAWVLVPPKDDPEAGATLLREAGFRRVSTLEGGLSRWTGAVARGPVETDFASDGPGSEGAADVAQAAHELVRHARAWGRVLDLACGTGANAVFLGTVGFEVVGVDRDGAALEEAARRCSQAKTRVEWIEADLEMTPPQWTPAPESFDAVLVSRYLWRPLMRTLVSAVRPGGVMAYETFTVDQPRFGKPTNPDFLLKSGELPTYFPNWKPLLYFEGPVGGRRARALWVGRRPMRGL